MSTRIANAADLDALVSGNLEMARETEGLSLDRARLQDGVRAVLEGRAPGAYHVLEDGGRVVAQLLVTYEWSDWRNRMVWWIQSVYVPPEKRRQGLFGILYRHVLQAARRGGAAGVRLYVANGNEPAQAVYEALGVLTLARAPGAGRRPRCDRRTVRCATRRCAWPGRAPRAT
jgi:GNAT superfamily N-acetyltransferase